MHAGRLVRPRGPGQSAGAPHREFPVRFAQRIGVSVLGTQSPRQQPHFLAAYPDVLPRAACEDIIRRFEADSRRVASMTAGSREPGKRSGTMLVITEAMPEWSDTVGQVWQAVRRCMELYSHDYDLLRYMTDERESYISYPLIERIDPGQGFDHHIDSGPVGTHDRVLSTLLYLRDVEAGGHTEFPYQSIRTVPRAGLMLVFPPFWTHPHRGVSPISGPKYNITNFLCMREASTARLAATG